jgi:hypothetical protein
MDFQFTFTPGVWLTRLNADTTLGPGGTTISVQDSLDLDRTEVAFGAELAIVKNDTWRLAFSGVGFSAEGSGSFVGNAQFGGVTINDGDPYTASFDFTTIAGEFGFWLTEPYVRSRRAGPTEQRLRIRAGALLGVRYIDLDQVISVDGIGSQKAEGEWLVPYGGLQLEMSYDTFDGFPLMDEFLISAGGVFGPALGGDGGTMAWFHAGITFQFTPNIGAGLEYRLIYLAVENGEYEFDGGLQGLFFFAALRF